MITIANTLAITLYLIATLYQGLFLLNKLEQAPKQTTLLSLGFIAVAAHSYSAMHTIYNGEHIDLGLFRISSLIFCFITAISLLSALRRPSINLLVVILPLAAVSIIVSSLSAPRHEMQNAINAGLFTHILSSILAYSLLTIAAVQAVTLALQNRHLKHHHIGSSILQALPPLQTMEQMLFELIWIGLGLLTLSLVSGVLFIDNIFAQHLVHKTFFSFSAWIIFAILLWGRHQLGWRGQTAIRWTLGGFVTLMVGYYGCKLVLEFILTGNPS
ncbi:MAG: cytochrome c biogenesis protein CcsA [Pseudomonadales bacterium]